VTTYQVRLRRDPACYVEAAVPAQLWTVNCFLPLSASHRLHGTS
jgi:hypothetical protein